MTQNTAAPTTYYFDCPSRRLDEVAPFGAVVRRASGKSTYSVHDNGRIYKTVGALVVTGDVKITIWPNVDVTSSDLSRLTGAAEDAFRNKPTRKTCWKLYRTKKNEVFWSTMVSLPINEREDVTAIAIRKALDDESATFEAKISTIALEGAPTTPATISLPEVTA